MNSKFSKKYDFHKILLNFSDKTDLKKSNIHVASLHLTIYCTWKKIRESCKTNKFRISGPIWNEKFELQDGSYSVSYIQNYFEYIIQKHETVAYNPSIRIYVNKIENKITFNIKAGYCQSVKV